MTTANMLSKKITPQDWDEIFCNFSKAFPNWKPDTLETLAWYNILGDFDHAVVIQAFEDATPITTSFPPNAFQVKARADEIVFEAKKKGKHGDHIPNIIRTHEGWLNLDTNELEKFA